MSRNFRELKMKRHQSALNHLTLGEVQLLLQGLHVIGEQNRVDLKMIRDYQMLVSQIRLALEAKAEASR